MLSCHKLRRDMAARESGRGRVNQAAGAPGDEDCSEATAA